MYRAGLTSDPQWCRRDHAQIIAEDKALADIFTKWCYMEWRNNNWRDCYSDEHYLGTLLASKVASCCYSGHEICITMPA